jgi:hypothetical protein
MREWSGSRPGRFTSGKRTPATHWIGGWVDPRAGLDDVEKRKFLTLPGLEHRPLGRPARSQSLYRLCCPGSWMQPKRVVKYVASLFLLCRDFLYKNLDSSEVSVEWVMRLIREVQSLNPGSETDYPVSSGQVAGLYVIVSRDFFIRRPSQSIYHPIIRHRAVWVINMGVK